MHTRTHTYTRTHKINGESKVIAAQDQENTVCDGPSSSVCPQPGRFILDTFLGMTGPEQRLFSCHRIYRTEKTSTFNLDSGPVELLDNRSPIGPTKNVRLSNL